MIKNITTLHRFFIVFAIVFAGEIIFSLPFHIARFFRPTLLDVFQLTNTQLGDIFGFYGIMAMLAYFPGGAIADRFSSRHLMAFSLFATAMGGLYFIQIPSVNGLTILFGYWGITTILLFWAAMIKVTRLWGGESTQGLAFGILDGGRGFVAAGIASISVLILTFSLPEQTIAHTHVNKVSALQTVIGFYVALNFIAGFLILMIIPSTSRSEKNTLTPTKITNRLSMTQIIAVLKQPKILLQALIVLSAYSAYKSLDYFGIYATTVLNMSDIGSAQLVSNASFIRPAVALAAGIIADRLQPSRLISWSFSLLVASYLLFIPMSDDGLELLQANVLLTFVLVFAIRAIYFSLLAESDISGAQTGLAVGLISVVGFTPDIFFAPIAGRILDASPGAAGFTILFTVLSLITAVGLISAMLLARSISHKPSQRVHKE